MLQELRPVDERRRLQKVDVIQSRQVGSRDSDTLLGVFHASVFLFPSTGEQEDERIGRWSNWRLGFWLYWLRPKKSGEWDMYRL